MDELLQFIKVIMTAKTFFLLFLRCIVSGTQEIGSEMGDIPSAFMNLLWDMITVSWHLDFWVTKIYRKQIMIIITYKFISLKICGIYVYSIDSVIQKQVSSIPSCKLTSKNRQQPDGIC